MYQAWSIWVFTHELRAEQVPKQAECSLCIPYKSW